MARVAGNLAEKDLVCDFVIVGCGVGGLYCALNLPVGMDVVMFSKGPLDECDSMLAQGGICVQRDAGDYAPWFEDTLRAGHYGNRRESVDAMIRSSRSVIDDLVAKGVEFERDENGHLRYTREGAHSRARICFHADVTGREITTKLRARVRELPNVRIFEDTCMDDIIIEHGADGRERCGGVLATGPNGGHLTVRAGRTVWATGGIGGLYERSTNYPLLTGDACRVARGHGIELEHMDYVQVHPTSLYTKKPGRAFLISESCRGEGAVLLDGDGRRFCDELQPRDVVSAAIVAQMGKEGTDHVRLSFRHVDPEVVRMHFSHIRERCLEEGYDILREPVPVVPAQHYLMGGVKVDLDSKTSMAGLFAVGETSCNGVHGKNRLASNSLMESLVFARRAAWAIASDRKGA